MIPSVIGAQVRRGIEEFLQTTFPITNPFFAGALDRLLQKPGEVFRGPYISLKLPFTASASERKFFPEVLPDWFKAHRHQEQAWDRLDWRAGQNTVVATGTGSGKTECFLYPVLDYCYQHRNKRGIKAILIYPMNALATDQAGRIAEAIYRSSALRGRVTAGLYLGEQERVPQIAMGETRVISHRDTMRDAPPDILLTNYKMLDYLLLRPKDGKLWRQNEPDTLRYLVVDELHTFDGAQGADVACLIRRLKERLGTPERTLICVGTSATLGADVEAASTKLLAYASTVFGEPFEAGAVVGESVQKAEDYFAGKGVRYAGVPGPETKKILDPLQYSSVQDYLQAQRGLWLKEVNESPDEEKWQTELGEQIGEHGFLRRVLDLVKGGATEAPELINRLAATLAMYGEPDIDYVAMVLGSFLALLSAARQKTDAGLRPLMHVRYQFWMRELARVVSSVTATPAWGFAVDLKADQLKKSMAVIHCRECGLTGWAGTVKDADARINPDLDTLYRSFFDNRPDVRFLFPGEFGRDEQMELPFFLCPNCLHFGRADSAKECSWCGTGAEHMIHVWIPDSNVKSGGQHVTVLKGQHDCPACEGHNSLTIVGSRAASLTAVMISQMWASPFYPGDKKLLAFSDNVQDASHRAGFFKARTFRFNLRAAIQKVLQDAGEAIALHELPGRFMTYWQRELKRPEQFLVTFLPPDMEWQEDYGTLRREGGLPADSVLPQRLRQRLDWDIWSEFTHNARIGRSLEKTGSSTVQPRRDLFEAAAEAVQLRLQNEVGGLRECDGVVIRRFLHGFLLNLKNRGGVWHGELGPYVDGLGNSFMLTHKNGREMYMPRLSPWSRLPEFLVLTAGSSRFLPLVSTSTSSPSWHTKWLERMFGGYDRHIGTYTREVYRAVIEELCQAKVLFETYASGVAVWGVALEALDVTTDVTQLRCDRCSLALSVGQDAAEAMADGACPQVACQTGTLRKQAKTEDYYGRLYQAGDVVRIFAEEHTGLLTREAREAVEIGFEKREKPGDPNLLSCTPTLEMGVDIGDLGAVALCSVPPKPSNYLQRAGRAGRKEGNSFVATVVNSRPHDLFFFEEPEEMLQGRVEPPGCYLNASAVLERQFVAFAMDRWVETGLPTGAIPDKLAAVLDTVEKGGPAEAFPFNLLTYFELNRTALEERFLRLFAAEVSEFTRGRLLEFSKSGLRARLMESLEQRARELKNWRGRVQKLNTRIRETQDTPMREEDRDEALRELRQEKSALQELVRSLRERNVLEFLTNEGLLPNYAFPEQGVTLRSIIWQQRTNEADPERRIVTTTY